MEYHLEILTQATIDKVKEFKRDNFLYEGVDKDIYWMLHKLKRQVIGFYTDDIAYELLTDAWLYVMQENGAKNLRMFQGFNPNSLAEVSIVNYLFFLLKNALINKSKQRRNQYLNEVGMIAYEGEDDSDMLGRVSNTRESLQIGREDTEYIDNLQSILNETEALLYDIEFDKRQVTNKERVINRLKRKVEKLKQEIDVEKGQVKYTPTEIYENEQEPIESMSETLELVVKVCQKEKYNLIILLGLIYGLNIKEISLFIGKDIKFCKTRLEIIKSEIVDYSVFMSFEEDDNTLFKLVKEFSEAEKEHKKLISNNINLNNVRRCYKSLINYFITEEFIFNVGNIKNELKKIYEDFFGTNVTWARN